jgi:glycosyltransferase involved in cell wall biosynthesis
MSDSPLLSILIPSFNQGEYIANTIESVLKQDYSNWELIIQDGGSTDSTGSICRQYENKDNRIRFHSEKDKGFADAVNKAINKARGNIAAIQSSDDFYAHSRVFSEAVETFKKHNDLQLFSSCHCYVDQELNELKVPAGDTKEEFGFIDPEKMFTLQVHFPQSSTFFRLERARHVSKLNQNVDMVADTDFWIRMANYSPVLKNSIYRSKEISSCVIVHENQRSVDQCQFALGRARMYFHYLSDPRFELSKERKVKSFYANLVDALDYFFSQKRNTAELKELYQHGTGYKFPLKWKIKEVLNKSGIFRRWYYRRIRTKSSLNLLSCERGQNYRWFKDK